MAPKALSRILASLRPRGPAAGEAGETLACEHLAKLGYKIVARNFRCRSGEVDVVARHGETTVFVEVKDRASASHGEGYEAVTFGKRRRIIRAAKLFAMSRGLFDAPLRFDVISIHRTQDAAPQLRHDCGAFDVEGVSEVDWVSEAAAG
jgi:putative endonuclease